MKTNETILIPPVRKAGPKKECDQAEIAATATKFFLALLEKYPTETRKMHARSIFDLQNRSSEALNNRQALIYVLGCNGFSHKTAADCFKMKEGTCVYIFRRAAQRYETELDFRELCNFIAGKQP
jgi:DNA-directed RNA polymerase specialized sigma24 family protein